MKTTFTRSFRLDCSVNRTKLSQVESLLISDCRFHLTLTVSNPPITNLVWHNFPVNDSACVSPNTQHCLLTADAFGWNIRRNTNRLSVDSFQENPWFIPNGEIFQERCFLYRYRKSLKSQTRSDLLLLLSESTWGPRPINFHNFSDFSRRRKMDEWSTLKSSTNNHVVKFSSSSTITKNARSSKFYSRIFPFAFAKLASSDLTFFQLGFCWLCLRRKLRRNREMTRVHSNFSGTGRA